MIHEVQGDILLSKAQLIVHGVAPNDHFEQGLALSLREKFPAMYQDFRHHYHVSHPECGNASIRLSGLTDEMALCYTNAVSPTGDSPTHSGGNVGIR